MFVKTHVSKHLHARRNRIRGMLRKLHRVMQNTVYAIAYKKRLFNGLDVNVGSALCVGVPYECIHNSDGRHSLGNLSQVLFLSLRRRFKKRSCFALNNIAQIILERLLIFLEGKFHRCHISKTRQNLEMRFLFYEINCRQIVGIQHCDLKFFAAAVVRDDIVAPRHRFRNERESRKWNFRSG